MKNKFLLIVSTLLCVGIVNLASTLADDQSEARAGMTFKPVTQNVIDSARDAMLGILDQVADRDFEDTVDYLTKADRDRIGDLSSAELSAFRSAAETLNRRWREKYGADIDSDSITRGGVPDATFREATSGGTVIMEIPESHGLPPVTLNFEHEGILNSLRLNVPDSVTGVRLANALTSQLQNAEAEQASWSSDRMVAAQKLIHRIALALATP